VKQVEKSSRTCTRLFFTFLSYFFKRLLCFRNLFHKSGNSFTLIVGTVSAVFDTLLCSAFSYLTDIPVINVSSVYGQAAITVNVFRFKFMVISFCPSFCDLFSFCIIILLCRYEGSAVRTSYPTNSNHLLHTNTPLRPTNIRSLIYKS
jgi:hypothetical protein